MKTIEFNGEHWDVDDRTLLQRVVHWLIWVGGAPVFRELVKQDGLRSVPRLLRYLTPISALGHRVTFFGRWMEMRLKRGVLVIHFADQDGDAFAYVSPDGTAARAHTWIKRAPGDIMMAALARSTPAEMAAQGGPN